MADIHILKGSVLDEYQANYQYVLHLPTGADAALQAKAQLDPAVSGFESAVPDIEPTELAAIRAGQEVEEVYSLKHHENAPPAEQLDRIRAHFAERAPLIAAEFNRGYRWYGNTYAA